MSVASLSDYREKLSESDKPRQIIFYGPTYSSVEGKASSVALVVNVLHSAEIFQIWDEIQRQGYAAVNGDGIQRFLIWPPAAIEIRDLSPEQVERLKETVKKPGDVFVEPHSS